MMSHQVAPSEISGKISLPPSKSAAHRALLCTALAGGGTVTGIADSHDMLATLNMLSAMGAATESLGNTVTVHTAKLPPGTVNINARESGTTLRLAMPVLAALGVRCIITGEGRLPSRPLGVYGDCLPEHGIKLSSDSLPLEMSGKLTAGTYRVPGNISSQFISGLLLALPLCEGDSNIILTTELESAPYIDMTIDMLEQFGVSVERVSNGWNVRGQQQYHSCDTVVESDWSQAAFPLAMGVLGGEVTLSGLNMNSRQGDRAVFDILTRMGADISSKGGHITCRHSQLRGININAADIPDMVPILAVLGAFADGVTEITGAARLRIKESDRLAAITKCLADVGAEIIEREDGLSITGQPKLSGGAEVDGHNDHRIVMSMAAAAIGCEKPLIIHGTDAVNKSWTDFFEQYTRLGGIANVVNFGK